MSYRIGLSDLNPKRLHKAFLKCLKECTFWPSVGELRAAYVSVAEDGVVRCLPASTGDEMTETDRVELNQAFDQTAIKLGFAKIREMSEADFEKRKQVLREQAAKLALDPQSEVR